MDNLFNERLAVAEFNELNRVGTQVFWRGYSRKFTCGKAYLMKGKVPVVRIEGVWLVQLSTVAPVYDIGIPENQVVS